MSFSFGMTQFTPFLSKLGYDPMQRGILLSSFAVMTIVLQILFGFLSDKYRTVKKFMVFALIAYALAAYLFYTKETQFFIYHIIAIGFSGGLINTSCGLGDTWVLSSSEYLRKRLSFIKAFGSIGWAVGSLILPMIIFKYGYTGVASGILLLCILSLGIIYFIKDVNNTNNRVVKKARLSDIKDLIFSKKYSSVRYRDSN